MYTTGAGGVGVLTPEELALIDQAVARVTASLGPFPSRQDHLHPEGEAVVVPSVGDPGNGEVIEQHPDDCLCGCRERVIRSADESHAALKRDLGQACWHGATAAEQETLRDARELRRGLVRLLIEECQQDLDGGEEASWDIRALADALTALDDFIRTESFEVYLEVEEQVREQMGIAGSAAAETVRFRCVECGKYMRLRPGNRRLRASGGSEMNEKALEALVAGLSQALAAAQELQAALATTTSTPAVKPSGTVTLPEGGGTPDGDMSPRDSEAPESLPSVPAENRTEKQGFTPLAQPEGGDAQPNDDMSPRDSETPDHPGAIPTASQDVQPNDDMSPRDTQTPEHPGAIPTASEAEAALTLVMHESGDEGTPPMLPTLITDPNQNQQQGAPPAQQPPPFAKQEGEDPVGEENRGPRGEESGGRDGEERRPDEDPDRKRTEAYKRPAEHRAEDNISHQTTAEDEADAAQAALERSAREEASKAFGPAGVVRRTLDLSDPQQAEAWLQALEQRTEASANLVLLANQHQPGTGGAEAARAERIRDQKVTAGAQELNGAVPEFDLSQLFSR